MKFDNYAKGIQNNLSVYLKTLYSVIPENYTIINIGDQTTDIPLIVPKINTKKILIVSGFHGDENSGPWSIIKYLKHNNNSGASFLPMVNPTGFKQFNRHSRYGHDPNIMNSNSIIYNNLGPLMGFSANGCLILHEDSSTQRENMGYLYHGNSSPNLIDSMINNLKEYYELFDNDNIHNGIGHIPLTDNTFESVLTREHITTIKTEYSSLSPLDIRIQCGYNLINTFIKNKS